MKIFLPPNAFDDVRFKGLSDSAKLLYSRIYTLSHGDHSKKLGGSVTASDKWFAEKCHCSTSSIYKRLNELKEWNLISTKVFKHTLTRTTRYITVLDIKSAEHHSPVNCDIAEDHSSKIEAPFIPDVSTIHTGREHHSSMNSIIDKEIHNTTDKVVDKVTLFDVDEDLLDRINLEWRRGSIKEESLNTLSPVEQKELFNWLEENISSKHKPLINTVVEMKLWKGNAYNKWIEENKPKPLVTPYEAMLGEASF